MMMINVSLSFTLWEEFNQSEKNDHGEGYDLNRDQPDINEAQVWHRRQLVHHTDEQSCGHQHHCQVD